MLSQGDSPASRSVSPENRREPKTKGICGRPQQPSLELSNPDLYCLKMCRESASICQWLSKTCADLGMRFQDPSSLGLMTLAHRTGESGSGLWPAMVYGSQWNCPGASKNAGTGLATAVKMWRTPSATEADHGGPNARDSKGGLHLSAQVMWPTPKSQNANGSGVHGNGGLDLQTAIDKYKIRIAPAISEEDFVQFASQLNPDWVEFYLMGWPRGWTSLEPMVSEEMKEYARKKTCTRSFLCQLRTKDGEESLYGEVGRHDNLPKAEVLQSELYGGSVYQGSTGEQDHSQTDGLGYDHLRTMQMPNIGKAQHPSYRRGSQEFQQKKLDGIVQLLSHEMALESWEEAAEREVGLHNMWDAAKRSGVLSKALPTLQEIWRSLSDEEKNILILCAFSGVNWSVDPADVGEIPRVATGVKDRVNRIKALGNGQVPMCVATAWNLLTQEDTK